MQIEKLRAYISQFSYTDVMINMNLLSVVKPPSIAKCPNLPKENEKHQKQVRFSERGNRETIKKGANEKRTTTKRYMHLWHKCLIMTNVLVGILVTVRNGPIGF